MTTPKTQVATTKNPAEGIIQLLATDPKFADFNDMFKTEKERDKFVRSFRLLTATNPAILQTDQASLFLSLYKAAHDGLIVDGVKATLTVFNTKQGDAFVKKAQYIPMVKGVRDKVYETTGWLLDAQIVYDNDHFIWEQGDARKLEHSPNFKEKQGTPIVAYAIARDVNGNVIDREVMRIEEINTIMSKTKSKDINGNIVGPWVDNYGEMVKKTLIKRLAKKLPLPEKVEEMMDRDNDYYELKSQITESHIQGSVIQQLNAQLKEDEVIEVEKSIEETIPDRPKKQKPSPSTGLLMGAIKRLFEEKQSLVEKSEDLFAQNVVISIASEFEAMTEYQLTDMLDWLKKL